MSANTFETVKAVILSAHKSTTPREKVSFYNSWADNYDQDVAVLDYRAPSLAANIISSHFTGDREAAVVLDVACGTGLVAKQMRRHGFGHFVGIDGSEAMLKLARESGSYQDLKQCMLGEDPLPAQCNSFDVVVIVGALSVGQVPVGVVRELCKSTKPGGYICMTTRSNHDNVEYKADLERELKQMKEEGLWSCVEVTDVEDWERAVSEQEDGYISGLKFEICCIHPPSRYYLYHGFPVLVLGARCPACFPTIPAPPVSDWLNTLDPGGYVCMTCRGGHDNLENKADLECELKRMEEEGLWSCVAVTEVKQWQRDMSELENSYISGSVYLYKK